MEHLTIKEIYERLQELDGWELNDNSIVKIFEFPDFKQAMEFVNHIAEEAERQKHHPDIDIRYNRVRIILATHGVNGVTHDDFKMAKIIEQAA